MKPRSIARKKLGQIVPKKSKGTENTPNIIKGRKPQGGGKRKGENSISTKTDTDKI
jgi:hypothetical protein